MISRINGFSQNLTYIINNNKATEDKNIKETNLKNATLEQDKGYYKEMYKENDPLKNAIADKDTKVKMIEKFQSFKEEIYDGDSDSEKFRKSYYNSLYDFFSKQAQDTKDGERFKIGPFGFSKSGFSADGRVTIWGKYLGYDKSMSNQEIVELRNFIDNNAAKIPGFEFATAKSGAVVNDEILALVDSADMDIETFKEKYQTANRNLENSFLQNKDIANKENIISEDKSKKFKPIQGKSATTETYDINKDERMQFANELLRVEQTRGIDVLEFMRELEKKIKGIDISV